MHSLVARDAVTVPTLMLRPLEPYHSVLRRGSVKQSIGFRACSMLSKKEFDVFDFVFTSQTTNEDSEGKWRF